MVTAEAWRAEVAAKAAFLAGLSEALTLATRLGAGARRRPGRRSAPDRRTPADGDLPGGDGMSPQLWWYVARAGGLVAYGLLAAATIWGLAVSTRLLGRWPAPDGPWTCTATSAGWP